MPQEQQMTMDQVRERFPEYDDMDDMTLANAIHGRFYSDMPLADFYAQVGFNPQQDAGDNGIYPDVRPGFSRENPIDLNASPNPQDLRKDAWVINRDGVVYQLSEDARTAPNRLGDIEESPGIYTRPFSVAADIAKAIPTGIVEGATGMIGTPGSVAQMVGFQPGQYVPGFGFAAPSGEQLNDELRKSLGRDYYQPQSVAGEYARTAGEFLPGLVAPGGTGAKIASWMVPALASETSGQVARAISRGQRNTDAENYARMGGGLIGGLGVGGASFFRSGGDTVLRNAAEGVTPQQLQMAAALRQRGALLGIDLTNAEALQQATGGGTGLGRLQRVVEGQSTRMAPTFAARPGQVQQAVANELDRLGPSVEPSALAGQARTTANRILDRTRANINAEARPFYGAADQQVISAEEYQALREMPAFREAEAGFYADPVLSQGAAGPQSVSALNRIIQEMDTLARNADPGNMLPGANKARSEALSESAQLAKMLVDDASPDYAQARAIGAAGRQNELVPLQRGPLGGIASQPELQPSLEAIDGRLFPAQPFEGQSAETARALELMGEIDPSVGGPLVRQHLARQAMEAQQQLATGDNQFGGANFAARAFGNPEQRRTVMGAIDATAPRTDPSMAFPEINPNVQQAAPSDPMARLVEVLQATGQRHRGGSETAFNTEAIQNLRGGNLATGAAQAAMNPLGVFGRAGRWVDDLTAKGNADSLADLLIGNSDEFNARLTRAINRPRGANRIRAGVAIGAGQED